MAQIMQQLGALSLSPPSEKRLPKLKEDRAAYAVGGKGFFNDRDKFLYPGQATYFDGEPNLDLIPLNKKAYDNMQAFLDKLDALGMKAAKMNNKTYIPLVRQEWREDGTQDELPTPDSVMGVRKDGPDDTIR
jgi:hypothetical protein